MSSIIGKTKWNGLKRQKYRLEYLFLNKDKYSWLIRNIFYTTQGFPRKILIFLLPMEKQTSWVTCNSTSFFGMNKLNFLSVLCPVDLSVNFFCILKYLIIPS